MTSRIETMRQQQLLVYLNTHGMSKVSQISDALQLDRGTIRMYLKGLQAIRAVRQSSRIDGHAATPYYTALILASPVKPSVPVRLITNRTTNLGTKREHPLPSPRGQGAVPRAFGIQSAMG